MNKYLIVISFIFLCNCSIKDTTLEHNFEDLVKIEDKFIYLLKSNNQRPSGRVYKILNTGEKKYIGKLSNGVPYGDWAKLNNNGNVLEKINFLNGIPGRRYVAIYHDNGEKSLEGSYLYNKKNGLFKMYYQSGINSFRGEYLNGSGVGMWSYFDNNGNLIKEIDCSIDDCE